VRVELRRNCNGSKDFMRRGKKVVRGIGRPGGETTVYGNDDEGEEESDADDDCTD